MRKLSEFACRLAAATCRAVGLAPDDRLTKHARAAEEAARYSVFGILVEAGFTEAEAIRAALHPTVLALPERATLARIKAAIRVLQ